jgi:hypothetical protein
MITAACGGVPGAVSDPESDSTASGGSDVSGASATESHAESVRLHGVFPTRDRAALLQGKIGQAAEDTGATDSPKPLTMNATTPAQPPMTLHDGPVMTATPVNVYAVWYGDWGTRITPKVMATFIKALGGSPYFNINASYTDANGTPAATGLYYRKAINDSYSRGTSLGPQDIERIITDAITAKTFTKDPNGIYTVFTSADVTVAGQCTSFCGWHSDTYMADVANTSIKYMWIGDAQKCPDACSTGTPSLNGDMAADAMVSTWAYELNATVTDPLGTAWYDFYGQENADKCAWNFGTTHKLASTGAIYNTWVGDKRYLLQQNWLNVGSGSCAIAN